jgi:hypothetical protein
MTRLIQAMAVSSLALCLSAASASAETVAGDALKALVAGKKVYLSTPYGIEFPLRYDTDGRVTGDASRFTLARMFAPRETGRWWVDGERLCQKWPSWYDGRTFCFTVRAQGTGRISWVRDDGFSGSARIEG